MQNSPSTVARPYPELTWVALIVGWIIGCVIAVSIGYAALILGFSIEGSELAAILGFGILRGMLRRKSIIENNIVQTIAVRRERRIVGHDVLGARDLPARFRRSASTRRS